MGSWDAEAFESLTACNTGEDGRRSAAEVHARTLVLQAASRRRPVGKINLLVGVIGYQPIMH